MKEHIKKRLRTKSIPELDCHQPEVTASTHHIHLSENRRMSFHNMFDTDLSQTHSSFQHDVPDQPVMASLQSTPKHQFSGDQSRTKFGSQHSKSPLEERDSTISSSTLAIEDHNPTHHDMNTQFDAIQVRINNAIDELESIYKVIGYTSSEVESKKSEIFSIVQDTINNFANSLKRKKSTLENECEWLKQQIQVILSMVNDARGDKSLSLLQKGLVFNNHQQYIDGYKEQILSKMSSTSFRLFKLGDELTVEQQYDYMVKNIPELTLLEQRSRLNMIFVEVLKVFVRLYKQYNALNIECAKLVASVGATEFDDKVISSMPSLSEAEMHRQVIEEFTCLISSINTNQTPDQSDNDVFVLASPVKSSSRGQSYSNDGLNQDNVKRLRETNYQLVRIMRSLKFTRISPDLVQALQQEIKMGRESLDNRKSNVMEIINKCLESIEFLQYSDEHLTDLQKNEMGESEGCLDRETLNLILRDPLEFGLHDDNINYLIQFQNLVEAKISEKREKWQYYSESCMSLWDRLGESEEYVNNFMQNNNNLSDLALLNFKMELNRLYIRRSEYIESFISDARIEIENLWDKMFYPQETRSQFQYFHYDPENDDGDKEKVLNIHEEEIKRLNKEYEEKAPILKVYNDLQELIKDQKFLQESSKDSSRLLSKNSCKILLHEEKIRKRINKTMPHVIGSLKQEVKNYNNRVVQEGKKPMSIDGKDFFEEVLRLESEHLNTGTRVKSKSAATSPMKRPISASKVSPERKPKSRFMSTRIPPAPSATRARIVKSPTTNTRQATIMKPIHQSSASTIHHVTKPSLSSSSSSQVNSSTLTMDSPVLATRTTSFTSKPPSVELKPLTSPLKLSTTKLNAPNNCKVERLTTNRHHYNDEIPENKENNSIMYGNDVAKLNEFPPLKTQSNFTNSREGVSSACTSAGNDTSTIIGDDYFAWRDEKIKQLNEL
ncbi:uncharacterized protein CPAR2_806860 [Candida parapsilosis]|uniref:Anaphase spindle elongation protein n=1 Tax=Candida parapsilosis (strain CDC 317 / ATCC MYA-4646) TaxID=578454 RepID=G8BAR3_CANPC|nr:uncharacterized protein CPAR2_806860 [Candida parapsilosis]CCE42137.1 hypothetical protein CPAR2_806860 [Candida parapsilosis]